MKYLTRSIEQFLLRENNEQNVEHNNNERKRLWGNVFTVWRLIHITAFSACVCGRRLRCSAEIGIFLSLRWRSPLRNPQTAAASVNEPWERKIVNVSQEYVNTLSRWRERSCCCLWGFKMDNEFKWALWENVFCMNQYQHINERCVGILWMCFKICVHRKLLFPDSVVSKGNSYTYE